MTGRRMTGRRMTGRRMTGRRMTDRSMTSGHITLEAAILIPMIVLFMVWLVFFMIFLLDMAVVKSEVIRISDEAAAIWDKDGDLPTGEYKLPSKNILSGIMSANGQKIKTRASSRLKKRIHARLMLTRSDDQKVLVGKKKVTVQASVRFSWPFSGEYGDILHGLEFKGKGVSPVDDWKEELRSASAVRELAENGGSSIEKSD